MRDPHAKVATQATSLLVTVLLLQKPSSSDYAPWTIAHIIGLVCPSSNGPTTNMYAMVMNNTPSIVWLPGPQDDYNRRTIYDDY